MNYAIFPILGYLLGSLNFSIIISKLFFKSDIRKHGSKNAGTTNMLRTFGKLPAIIVLVLDASKGVIAYLIALLITHDQTVSFVAAAFAALGHNFPVFFGFKGGKGVITSVGAIICVNPLIGVIATICGVLTIAITKYVSFGAMLGGTIAIILVFLLKIKTIDATVVILLVVMIFIQHRENIKRLLTKTENKISFKKNL